MLYFMYSTWQGNDLSAIKNFLNIHSPLLNIPSLPTLTTNYIEQVLIVHTLQCYMSNLKNFVWVDQSSKVYFIFQNVQSRCEEIFIE